MSDKGGGSASDDTDTETRQAASETDTESREDTAANRPDRRPTGLAGRIALVLAGVILLATVAGGNVAIAADQTVLDSSHVIEQMDEERLFAEQAGEFRDEVADEIAAGTEGLSLPPGLSLGEFDPQATAEESVTDAYVREQAIDNIEQLYAFLHGDRDDLTFAIDIGPVKRSVAESVTENAVVDTATLVGEGTDRLDSERVAALGADEESFQEAQLDTSDRQVEALKADIESDTESRGYTAALTDALVSLQFTVVDGLTGELTYEEYITQRDANEDELKGALGTEAVADIGETITLGGEDEDPSETFSGAADIVQLIETLTLVLPALALALVGVIGGLTRDLVRTARVAGGALLGAGLLGVVARFVAPGFVMPDGEETDALADGLVATVESMFETLGTQSILLAAVGVVLVGLAVADRRGYLDGITGS